MPTPPTERTPLVQTHSASSISRHYDEPTCYRPSSPDATCDHGTISPHAVSAPTSPPTSPPLRPTDIRSRSHPSPFSTRPPQQNPHSLPQGGASPSGSNLPHKIFGDALAEGVLGNGTSAIEGPSHSSPFSPTSPSKPGTQLSTTQYLAQRHGIKNRRKMYLSYYFPFLNWIVQYKWAYLQGDAVAALTMASFYIPMALSYAENLGHVPPINGLYSFVFNPFIYALLGTCPRMVVGPEAAGSLLVGSVVRTSVDSGSHADEDGSMNARVAGVVTGMAGAVIFLAGLTRLGFLDSVLSRPFLRGFISAIGLVIMVDQLVPELGLARRIKHAGGAAHGSSYTKVRFLVDNIRYSHGPTAAVAFGSFAIIMVCRYGLSLGRLTLYY